MKTVKLFFAMLAVGSTLLLTSCRPPMEEDMMVQNNVTTAETTVECIA